MLQTVRMESINVCTIYVWYTNLFNYMLCNYSLANKITSGKNLIMKNLRGLEQKIMQDNKPELLDVKMKHSDNNQPTSPVSYSGKTQMEVSNCINNVWKSVNKSLNIKVIYLMIQVCAVNNIYGIKNYRMQQCRLTLFKVVAKTIYVFNPHIWDFRWNV